MFLKLDNIHFAYPDQSLFAGLNLQLKASQNTAIIGESGCGKSTLLKLVYGQLDWPVGDISFKNQTLYGPKANLVPGEKNMKMVAQDFDLMPYATVFDNVGKFLSNVDLAAKRHKINELLQVVDLLDFAPQKVKFLSGGQKQRVAIAQALSQMPELLILDEAFSNLDFHIKNKIKSKIFAYAKQYQMGVLMSSHHLEELVPWVDEVVVMHKAQIICQLPPHELYQTPANAYVASLLGEVNTWDDNFKQKHQLSQSFGMAHSIKINPNGPQAQVLESRFAGQYYWNKIELDGQELIMYSNQQLNTNINISF